MTKAIGVVVLVLLMGGCATVQDAQMLGDNKYSINATYGLAIDGDYDSADAAMNKKARELCRGEFNVLEELKNPRRTAWGSENGQITVLRVFECATQDYSSVSGAIAGFADWI